jgi:predicted DNA-binding protein
MLPGTKGKTVKFPLPWGFNLFWNIGTEMSRAFTKEEFSPLASAGRLASVFANAFNPVASGTLLQTISPTVTDPLAMVAENKNWFGGNLMPEKDKFAKVPKPDSQRYWKTAGVASKWVTEQMNSLTGGDKIKPGAIDVSPETLDLVVDTIGGSALRFVRDVFGVPLKAVQGEEIKMSKIPFLRRVAGEKSEWADSKAYYENVEDIYVAEAQLKAYRGTPKYGQVRADTKFERTVMPLTKATEKRLRVLRKQLNRAKARNNKALIKRIEKAINDVYVRYNKRYRLIQGRYQK